MEPRGIEPLSRLCHSHVLPLNDGPFTPPYIFVRFIEKLVEPRGVEPRSQACKARVLPLYDGPVAGSGVAPHIALIQCGGYEPPQHPPACPCKLSWLFIIWCYTYINLTPISISQALEMSRRILVEPKGVEPLSVRCERTVLPLNDGPNADLVLRCNRQNTTS